MARTQTVRPQTTRSRIAGELSYALEPHRRLVCLCLPASGPTVLDSAGAIVGFDLSSLTSGFQTQFANAQQRAGTAIQSGAAAQGAAQGALAGAQSGGLAGAATGAARGLLESTGIAELGRAIAGPLYEAWGGGATQGPPRDAADLQTRRNASIRDLYHVAAEPSHAYGNRPNPWSADNWEFAMRWNARNLGIQGVGGEGTPATSEFLALYNARTPDERRAILSTLDPRSPYITDGGTIALPPGILRPRVAPRSAAAIAAGLPYPWPAGTNNQDLVNILLAAQQAGTAPPVLLQSTTTPAAQQAGPLPSVAAAVASGAATPRDVAGVEVLSQALNTLLSSESLRSQLEPEIARTIAYALRSLETEAGAALGSPRAQDVLRRARLHVADEVARGMSLARLLTRA